MATAIWRALLGNKPGVRGGRGRPRPEDLADGKELFEQLSRGEIRSGGFDLNGMWSPWYTLHKTYAGLKDAYRFTGNKTALDVEIKFADWTEKILSPLNDEQIQRMLNTEFGGMNEIFVDLYADTGDKRWLDFSYKFEHKSFIEPLKKGEDNLAGKHGNTQVPKLIGSLARYAAAGDESDLKAARFFWERVAHHHSFATGGHGKDEYFGEPDKLSDRIDGRTAETCNVYNMLKLTRKLFALKPDVKYAEFHERRCSITSWARSTRPTAARATWCQWAWAFSASIRACSKALRAALEAAWKATRCTVRGFTMRMARNFG